MKIFLQPYPTMETLRQIAGSPLCKNTKHALEIFLGSLQVFNDGFSLPSVATAMPSAFVASLVHPALSSSIAAAHTVYI